METKQSPQLPPAQLVLRTRVLFAYVYAFLDYDDYFRHFGISKFVKWGVYPHWHWLSALHLKAAGHFAELRAPRYRDLQPETIGLPWQVYATQGDALIERFPAHWLPKTKTLRFSTRAFYEIDFFRRFQLSHFRHNMPRLEFFGEEDEKGQQAVFSEVPRPGHHRVWTQLASITDLKMCHYKMTELPFIAIPGRLQTLRLETCTFVLGCYMARDVALVMQMFASVRELGLPQFVQFVIDNKTGELTQMEPVPVPILSCLGKFSSSKWPELSTLWLHSTAADDALSMMDIIRRMPKLQTLYDLPASAGSGRADWNPLVNIFNSPNPSLDNRAERPCAITIVEDLADSQRWEATPNGRALLRLVLCKPLFKPSEGHYNIYVTDNA